MQQAKQSERKRRPEPVCATAEPASGAIVRAPVKYGSSPGRSVVRKYSRWPNPNRLCA